MRNFKFGLILFCMITATCLLLLSIMFGPEPTFILNKGKKWKIAYYEGGDYEIYRPTFFYFLKKLEEMSLINPIGTEIKPTRELWNSVTSNYFEFSDFYSSNWMTNLQSEQLDELKRKIDKKDIDILYVSGSWGVSLINSITIPTIVTSISDATSLGLIDRDKLLIRWDHLSIERGLKLFYELFKFKTLGIVYNPTKKGMLISGTDRIIQVAKELNFEIIPCFTEDSIDAERNKLDVDECFKELSYNVEAAYVSYTLGFSAKHMKKTIQPMIDKKVPVFSVSYLFVKSGVLMSYGVKNNTKFNGENSAEGLVKILKGSKAKDLPNPIFDASLALTINRRTAKLIDFRVPEVFDSLTTINYEE